ncbi:hypothetical protein [Kitasatospora phosalacinea]|uniref:Uncharacterized protein n=1 Tax=Kitasatospora phosalacinea TaxID=2065 RepID=A0A9W6PHB6_9ACTN|nr:hypothetical protein [Kitasatospora phosalacinea]GLW56150.1 hypothetical protein Kpho01_41610 [Kitasatospora phosalacinea]
MRGPLLLLGAGLGLGFVPLNATVLSGLAARRDRRRLRPAAGRPAGRALAGRRRPGHRLRPRRARQRAPVRAELAHGPAAAVTAAAAFSALAVLIGPIGLSVITRPATPSEPNEGA